MSDHIIDITDIAKIDDNDTIDIIELSSYEECCICLNTLDKKEQDQLFLRLGCCGKMLHKGCLISWMCYGNYTELKCPMCRSDILNITSLVSLNDICNANTQLNNNTLSMIEQYYREDQIYGEYTRRRDMMEMETYFRIDKTFIYSVVVWIIILTFSLIFLFVSNVKNW